MRLGSTRATGHRATAKRLRNMACLVCTGATGCQSSASSNSPSIYRYNTKQATMSLQRKQFGAKGEQQARESLESQGMQWLASNIRTRYGEIDLLMQDGKM